MRVRIHRGAHEIGGSCVEIDHDGTRIVLDVGKPLDASDDDHVPLPASIDESVAGVLISHYHQDHWGLIDQVPASVPLYIGEAASRILAVADYWTRGVSLAPIGYLAHRKPFEIGPFTITPFLNDHSAFDAYSMLVEAGGKRLFYTGDIRGHGRKSGIFQSLVNHPPKDIDVLLMEGTNIRPEDDEGQGVEEMISEDDVEIRCAERMHATEGIVLAYYSAQNIDRVVTLYNAAKSSGRVLVQDLYGASVAKATGNSNIPFPGSTHEIPVRVFVPLWQRVKVKKSEEFWRVDEIKPYRIFPEELAADPSKWVIAANIQTGRLLDKAGVLEGASAIWSMWPGYLKEGSGKAYADWLVSKDIRMNIEHTSGHASVPDLRRLAKALTPKQLVPIHSFGSLSYPELFENVKPHDDGTWWEV